MNIIFSRKLSGDANVLRIEMLFKRLPTSVMATLIGIFLCCAVLFDIIGLALLKGWAAYMLSVLAAGIWIWYMFGKVGLQSDRIYRWEWLFAAVVFAASFGWGALFWPLYPPPTHPDAQVFVVLLVVVIAFTGSVLFAMSNLVFWLSIIPALLPALMHYALGVGVHTSWPIATAASCMAVLIILQRTLYRSAADSLQRGTDVESLLAEQQAIFESSPMGIAVIDNKHVVKCNARLGEMLGRRIQDLTTASLHEHFANVEEANKFLADRTEAFDKGHVAQGIYRLRRADGSQFWAEFSGRKMAGGPTHSVWMIADVTFRVASSGGRDNSIRR
jgi:PAS domain S-box-containing protein